MHPGHGNADVQKHHAAYNFLSGTIFSSQGYQAPTSQWVLRPHTRVSFRQYFDFGQTFTIERQKDR